MAFTIATTTKKTLHFTHSQSTASSKVRPKKSRPIRYVCEETKSDNTVRKCRKLREGKGGGNTARVNKTSSHISGDTTERLISIEACCQADREKQRRLIWSALIISRAADFLSFGPYSHSAIRAEAANRGRNIKSFQAALTQWELAELRY